MPDRVSEIPALAKLFLVMVWKPLPIAYPTMHSRVSVCHLKTYPILPD